MHFSSHSPAVLPLFSPFQPVHRFICKQLPTENPRSSPHTTERVVVQKSTPALRTHCPTRFRARAPALIVRGARALAAPAEFTRWPSYVTLCAPKIYPEPPRRGRQSHAPAVAYSRIAATCAYIDVVTCSSTLPGAALKASLGPHCVGLTSSCAKSCRHIESTHQCRDEEIGAECFSTMAGDSLKITARKFGGLCSMRFCRNIDDSVGFSQVFVDNICFCDLFKE